MTPLTVAALIAACASLQTATAAIPFYSPSSNVNVLKLYNVMTLEAAKQHIAALLPKWRLLEGGVIARATVDSAEINIVDAIGQQAVLPLNPAPDAFDIKVTYTTPTAPTLHIGSHTLVPTAHLSPRDVRVLADAINIARLSQQQQGDW